MEEKKLNDLIANKEISDEELNDVNGGIVAGMNYSPACGANFGLSSGANFGQAGQNYGNGGRGQQYKQNEH